MKSQKIIFIIALTVAAVTILLTYNYLTAINKPQVTVATRNIVIAAQDIAARTTITPAMLTTVERPADSIDIDAFTNPSKVSGFLALTSIPKGAVITASRIGKPDNAPLPVRLKKGTRALTIPIDPVSGVAGFIEPGDYVDLIAVMNRGDDAGKVKTFMHDVLVIAIGNTMEQASDPQASQAQAATTATLAVTPKQAEVITLAYSASQIRLTLRPPGDRDNHKDDGFSLPTTPPQPIQPMVAAPAVEQHIAPATPAPTPAAPRKPVAHDLMVTVIDGDHVVGSDK